MTGADDGDSLGTYEIPGKNVQRMWRKITNAHSADTTCHENLRSTLCALGDLAVKPGFRVSPVVVGGSNGDPEHFSSFLNGHSDEETQFYDLRFEGLLCGEFVEGFVYGEELVVVTR